MIVGQHVGRDLAGHRLQQGIALGALQHPRPLGRGGQDLDIDLVIGGVDPRGIVDGVGVDPPAHPGEGDAPRLGHAQIGPLAHHLAAQLRSIDAHGVIGLVADLQLALGRRFHIGADAAQIEQLDPRLEDGADQVCRGQGLRLDVEQGPHLRRQGYGLGRARPHPAALGNLLRIV